MNPEAIESLQSPLARVVEVHGALGSTQERARELAHAGTPHGTLVIAEIQTGGRGRLGRHWGSPKGGLWMSLVLRPRFAASLASRITQTAAVGVAKALWEVGVEVRIKWPNDLLAGGKKVCGILAESAAGSARETVEERRLDHVILGVGMNANLDPAELAVQN
ncbi:MAG TPA: biotin--[acetyl-CoA-carboxylase] ligase, partial [Rubrobacter sp.]|nr:biotin--[acetyl-CoA-carboxylase] ligase [Rubrobacter sp.]